MSDYTLQRKPGKSKMKTTCCYGSGKQDMAKCPMIYIHWPGYYPTEESYQYALAHLCPNKKMRVFHYTSSCGTTYVLDKLSVLMEMIEMDLAEGYKGDSIDVSIGEMSEEEFKNLPEGDGC